MAQIIVEHNINGIQGLAVITPTVHADSRGYFMETYNQNEMRDEGLNFNFVQENQSCSKKGVLRGMHFQKKYPQSKLIRVIMGLVYDVAIDLRKNSNTFKKFYGIYLSNENSKQLLIPKGFAHGFLVLSDIAIFTYKVDDFWHPNDESGIIWNDSEINITWPVERLNGLEVSINEKDKNNPTVNQLIGQGLDIYES